MADQPDRDRVEVATDALVETRGNKTAALRIAGYSDPNANASRFFEQPHVKEMVKLKMRGAGIKPSLVYRRLREALNSKETKFYKGVPIADCVDNANRLAAVDMCLKLMGDIQESKGNGKIVNTVFNVIVQAIDSEAPKEVGPKILAKIAAGLRNAK
jgi:hypothetical protein